MSSPAVDAASDEPGALAADRRWVAALEQRDDSAAGALLDADFEWTDQHGRTRNGADSLKSADALRAELLGESDVQTYDYGHVHVITSARPGIRFMRVWALRPEGWRALAVISTASVTGVTPFAATAAASGDCENPCRTMPFMPQNENQEIIAGIFRQLKMDEWHPDPERWAPYVLDDVFYVTATAQLSKADRVARLAQMKETNARPDPGDPVEWMRIIDFEDAAVMRARHASYHGGRPYYSVRVWALRDGRWQLANTQQTVIADASVPATR